MYLKKISTSNINLNEECLLSNGNKFEIPKDIYSESYV